jgi:putative tricarboxylic transport membrane protein
LPQVPATTEFVPGFEMVSWIGLAVRDGTELAIVERLSRESIGALKDPNASNRLAQFAFETMLLNRDEFVKFWYQDVRRTRRLIHDIGLKME